MLPASESSASRRRRVLLVDRHDIEHSESPTVADEDLLVRLDYDGVGRLSEIVPVRRMEPVAEHISSVPGPDGEADAISEA